MQIIQNVDQSKKEGKDQELIQSSTTPDPGYQWESDNVTIADFKGLPYFSGILSGLKSHGLVSHDYISQST